MMISTKKLINFARKWRRLAVIKQKRVTFQRSTGHVDRENCSTTARAKGHFVVYTIDRTRFVLPLKFLSNKIIKELFKLAEEEFGLQSDGPLTLPCDAGFMEYIIALIQRHVAKDVENALLISLSSSRCSSSVYPHKEVIDQHKMIRSF